MRLHRHVPQKLEPRPHTGRTGRAPALILHAMRSLESTKWGVWDHHRFSLSREWHQLTWMSTEPGRHLATKPTRLGPQMPERGRWPGSCCPFCVSPSIFTFYVPLAPAAAIPEETLLQT